METKQPSATITDAQRLKLIKWAKKNGALRISVGGVEIEFASTVEVRPIQKLERDLNEEIKAKLEAEGQPSFYDPIFGIQANLDDQAKATEESARDARLAAFHADRTWPHKASDSTESAISALRSRLEDPEAFARQTDAWANQTRLPRE